MKVGKKAPESRTLLVKTGQTDSGDEHNYDLYMIAPEVIAQLKWDGKLSWYTEDQMRFQGAQSAIDYVTRERSKNIQTLKPGKYNLEYTSVDQQDDRIVIKTKTGEKIIIQLGDD